MSEKLKVKAVSEVTPEDILGWKAKYGVNALDEVTVKSAATGETSTFILCVPGRSAIDAVASYGAKQMIVESNKILIANSVLAGDMERVETDGTVYTSLLDEIRKKLQKAEVTTKKL